MINSTPNEQAAMKQGGKKGGTYLEGLGQTDLSQLSLDQWQAFISCVITGYCDHLRELADKDQQQLSDLSQGVPF